MNVFETRIVTGLLGCMMLMQTAQAQPDPAEPGTATIPDPVATAPLINDAPGQAVAGNFFGYTEVNTAFDPLLRIDARGGSTYVNGFTRVSAFLPFWGDSGDSLYFLDAGGFAAYNPSGGANVGFGYRTYIDDLDSIFGVNGFYDFDAGNQRTYHQVGLGIESLSRFVDYRLNGYLPVGTTANTLSSRIGTTAFFDQSFIGVNRFNQVETSFAGFDAELGGPVPFLGRYGLNAYAGAYFFHGNNVGNFTGVSARLQGQVNEAVTVGAQFTHDHMFDSNAQIQVTLSLPDGSAPGRWLRAPRVRDRLTAQVFRNHRVVARVDQQTSSELLINPGTNLPFFVAHIDPNKTPGTGIGTFENQYSQLSQFNNLPPVAKGAYDIIYVRPRADDTSTQLNTGVTLLSDQRLLSTSIPHTFTSTVGTFALPGFTGGPLPILSNVGGGDVVTFATGNRNIEVSGFTITGSATGYGITGVNNQRININRNVVQNGLDGVGLFNLSGTAAGASDSVVSANSFINNVGHGFSVINNGPVNPLDITIANNTATGNGINGFNLEAGPGAAIRGRITGNTTAFNGVGTSNFNSGLALTATGGTFDFNSVFNDWRIGGAGTEANSFSDNSGMGVEVFATNNSTVALRFLNNNMSRNTLNGLSYDADSGTNILTIGSVDATLGNRIESNLLNGIRLNLTGTSQMSLNIQNNLISGGGGPIVPVISTNFLGSTSNASGFIPPDTMGGVGPNHIVEMLNGVFAIYDKNGTQLSSVSLNAFYDSVAGITRNGTVFDPRIIYDPTTGRWFAAVIDGGAANTIYLAVSDTADPTGTWRGTQFVGDTVDGSRFNDYVTLGIDGNSVVMATNNFGAGFDVSVFSIPKADLIDGNPDVARMTRFEALNSGAFGSTIQASVDFGAPEATTQLLADLGGGTNLARTDLTGTGGAGATAGPNATVTVPTYTGGPPGRQPSGITVENVSPRFVGNVVEVGNSLWAVHAVAGTAGNSAVRWYQIDATTNTVIQTGLIEDPNRDFLDPSIAVNPAGSVLIGYTGGGPNQFLSSMASVGRVSGGVVSFNAPIVLQAGAANYFEDFGSGRNRWGDYSATVVDPSNPNRFWTFQERVAAADTWGVQITAVDLQSAGGGTGDGINISVADTANLNPAVIQDNTITQSGRHGIYVTANGNVTIPNLQIQRNQITGNGGGTTGSGIFIDRFDSSTINLFTTGNVITNNVVDGLTVNTRNLAAGGVNVTSSNNSYNSNLGNGVNLQLADNADVNFASTNDLMSQNTLNGVNIFAPDNTLVNFIANRSVFDQNGANGVNATTQNNGIINLTLNNISASTNGSNGVNLAATDNSFITTLIDSPVDPLFTGRSTISNNRANGVNSSVQAQARQLLTINRTDLLTNTGSGVNITRADRSLEQVVITNSSVNGNGGDGVSFLFAGATNTNPLQPLPGTPNSLQFLNSQANSNAGNGLNIQGRADGVLIANATLSTFNSNGLNGVLVTANQNSQFGLSAVDRSIFNGITATGNGNDGLQFNTNLTFPTGAFMFVDVNANSGNTLISGNTGDGIDIFANGITPTDILIRGDENPAAPTFTTTIARNSGNGINATSNSSLLLNIRGVTIGGANGAGNSGNGILLTNNGDATINIGSGAAPTIIQGNRTDGIRLTQSGSGLNVTANITNTQVLDSTGHGLNIIGNGALDEDFADTRYFVTATSNQFRRNGLNGTNIVLTGDMGSRGLPNSFVFDNNLFANNGTLGTDIFTSNGFFYQANAQDVLKAGTNNLFRQATTGPAPGAFPVNPANPGLTGDPNYNASYLNLGTALVTDLTFTRNILQTNGNIAAGVGDGVYLRTSTNTYLSADVGGASGSGLGNTFSGHVLSDFRTGTFLATARGTGTGGAAGTVFNPPPGADAADPNPDTLFLDDTAQLDLRFKNNIGVDMNPGLTEVAFYTNSDAAKGVNNTLRVTELIQVDGTAALIDATNNFILPNFAGFTESDIFNLGNWRIRSIEDPAFPNPAFPENFATDPFDPELN